MSASSTARAGAMKRGLAWSVASTILGAIGSLIVTPVLVAHLGAGDFGVYLLILALTSYAGLFDLGLTWAAGRFLADDVAGDRWSDVAQRFHTLARFLLGVGALSVGAAVVVGPPLLRLARSALAAPSTVPLVLAGLSFALMLQGGLAASLLRACQRFETAGRVAAIGSVLLPAGSLLAVRASAGLTGLLAVNLLVNGVVLALYLNAVRPELRRADVAARWASRYLREMAAFGGWSSLGRVLLVVMLQVDRLAVALLGSVSGLTYYAVPANLASRVNLLGGPMANMFLSRASLLQAQGKVAELDRQQASGRRFLIWTAAAAAVPLALLGPRFLGVWIGPDMAARGGRVLILLSAAYAISAVASIDAVRLEAMGRPDLPVKAMLAWAVIAIAVIAGMGPAFGPLIVAYAVGGWLAAVGVTNIVMLRRVAGHATSAASLGLATARFALCLLAAAGAGWVLQPRMTNVVTGLACLAGVGLSFAACGVVLILGPDERRFLAGNLARAMGRQTPAGPGDAGEGPSPGGGGSTGDDHSPEDPHASGR